MIIILGKSETANILHVVIGPETEFWCDLHGSAVANISQILPALEKGKPILLQYNRCQNEKLLTQTLKTDIESGGEYPFSKVNTVFVREDEEVKTQQAVNAEAQTGKCLKCHNPSAKLVPGISPEICYDCVTLGLNLADSVMKERKDE